MTRQELMVKYNQDEGLVADLCSRKVQSGDFKARQDFLLCCMFLLYRQTQFEMVSYTR